jgi:hypothetical protein
LFAALRGQVGCHVGSGRVGWLATPNLLLFGTGGFAYGSVAGAPHQIH